MDVAAHVWNVWNEGSAPEPVRTFSHHTSAIKDAQWSPDGTCVLTCGFDQTSRLVDVESGSEIQVFKEDQFINVVKFHPINKDEFLSGGSKGSLKLWDIRTGGMVLQYHKSLGQVMDVDFNREGKRFVSASDVADENVSEKAIIVWDFATQVPLSNQVSEM
jgi:WD40 repeat protein